MQAFIFAAETPAALSYGGNAPALRSEASGELHARVKASQPPPLGREERAELQEEAHHAARRGDYTSLSALHDRLRCWRPSDERRIKDPGATLASLRYPSA
jgi:hypothetical protein